MGLRLWYRVDRDNNRGSDEPFFFHPQLEDFDMFSVVTAINRVLNVPMFSDRTP